MSTQAFGRGVGGHPEQRGQHSRVHSRNGLASSCPVAPEAAPGPASHTRTLDAQGWNPHELGVRKRPGVHVPSCAPAGLRPHLTGRPAPPPSTLSHSLRRTQRAAAFPLISSQSCLKTTAKGLMSVLPAETKALRWGRSLGTPLPPGAVLRLLSAPGCSEEATEGSEEQGDHTVARICVQARRAGREAHPTGPQGSSTSFASPSRELGEKDLWAEAAVCPVLHFHRPPRPPGAWGCPCPPLMLHRTTCPGTRRASALRIHTGSDSKGQCSGNRRRGALGTPLDKQCTLGTFW